MGNVFTARKVEFEVQPNNQRPIIGNVKFVYFAELEIEMQIAEILGVDFIEMLGRITR